MKRQPTKVRARNPRSAGAEEEEEEVVESAVPKSEISSPGPLPPRPAGMDSDETTPQQRWLQKMEEEEMGLSPTKRVTEADPRCNPDQSAREVSSHNIRACVAVRR